MEKKFLSSLQMGTKDKQFKMMIEPELDLRLKQLADKYGKHSGQALVEELIEIYLPVWVSVNDSLGRATRKQINIIEKEILKRIPAVENQTNSSSKVTEYEMIGSADRPHKKTRKAVEDFLEKEE